VVERPQETEESSAAGYDKPRTEEYEADAPETHVTSCSSLSDFRS
jgi:hypothetical protein